MSEIFVEATFFNRQKHKKVCSGDVFLSERSPDGNHVIAILTDGLGSGHQANVAASLTATMAMAYMKADIDLHRAAEMIMDALPLCPERHITYSTFTMIDAASDGTVKMIEYENPPATLFRGSETVPIARTVYMLPRWGKRKMTYATFVMQQGDRLYFGSDGVTQAGLGSAGYPFGWELNRVVPFIQERLLADLSVSSQRLCQQVVNAATALDGGYAGDDTTACMIYYRQPKVLRVLTGPPFQKNKDHEYAQLVDCDSAKVIISGGSTANLIARELGREMDMVLTNLDPEIPAESTMLGADLITEGCITLAKVIDILKSHSLPTRVNAATKMCDLLLDSDQILFAVGTAINPAHQDPNLPVTLDIRRNIIKRLAKILKKEYLKEVFITYY